MTRKPRVQSFGKLEWPFDGWLWGFHSGDGSMPHLYVSEDGKPGAAWRAALRDVGVL